MYPQNCDGLPIQSVILRIHKADKIYEADSLQIADFYHTVNIYPGSTFNENITNMAVRKVMEDSRVSKVDYQLYSNNFGSPLIMVFNIFMLQPGERREYSGKTGMIASHSFRDFPMIIETNSAELSFMLNGAAGLYNENNAFFSEGVALTQGNPIANDPAGKGVRFWGEAFVEPGLAGIIKLWKSNIYTYGAASVLISGRNTADIYSSGAHMYTAFEKLYAGVLFTRIGKANANLNISYGRQTFQLNDGFLFSKFSGSSNAGNRASVYLNSRTCYHAAGLIKLDTRRWNIQGFYLVPEQLFKSQQNTVAYVGGYAGYNDNRHWDIGFAYINRIKSNQTYATPQGAINQKGLYVLNPKIWISNIGNTGIFFKSEYAFEGNSAKQIKANGFYIGLGADLQKLKMRPMFYYRFAYMQGDDENSHRYTRFDPLLTGGLGDWVQGINMRKILGNGNIISHRIQARFNPTPSLDFSVDYFHLRADTYTNLGSMAPLSELKSKKLGDEVTVTSHWYINSNFMLLGLFSYAIPGKGVREALPSPVGDWSSVQLALFMFF